MSLTLIDMEMDVQLSKRRATRLQNTIPHRASDIRISAEYGQGTCRFAFQCPLHQRRIIHAK